MAIGILLPPIGVLLWAGCGVEFLIACGLTLLGVVPGSVYACVLIGTDKPTELALL